jgi:prophage regulatory protein
VSKKATRILRRPEVLATLGISASTLARGIAAGRYPKPVAVGTRAVGWRDTDVQKCIARLQPSG